MLTPTKTGRNDGGRPQKERGWVEYDIKRDGNHGQFCQHCQAWRGSLGLEPSLEMYIEHLVEIFRETRRMLKDTGVLILNLGDSYASSTMSQRPNGKGAGITGDKAKNDIPRPPVPLGLKPKDLMGIPWRVALALQADGWYLRSAMPWLKASAMPESVRDRPTTAHEYVFLLSKSKKYYWDPESIRAEMKPESAARYKHDFFKAGTKDAQGGGRPGGESNTAGLKTPNPSGRNYRTTDAYIAPLDHAIAQARAELTRLETLRDTDGLLLDEDGNPVALRVNPGNFKGAHFATFPVGLVEPFVRAGSSEKGQCPECGAAWVRVVEKTRKTTRPGNSIKSDKSRKDGARADRTEITSTTTGWRPSCACPEAPPVPQTILDPFGGAMTTMLVADRLQRNGIACELNPDYAEMGRERLVSDGGMFMDARIE